MEDPEPQLCSALTPFPGGRFFVPASPFALRQWGWWLTPSQLSCCHTVGVTPTSSLEMSWFCFSLTGTSSPLPISESTCAAASIASHRGVGKCEKEGSLSCKSSFIMSLHLCHLFNQAVATTESDCCSATKICQESYLLSSVWHKQSTGITTSQYCLKA